MKYSKKYGLEEVHKIMQQIHKFFPEVPVVALPYDIELLFDCPLDILYAIQNKLNQIIWAKEQKNGTK